MTDILKQDLENLYKLSISAWGSKELADYMCQDSDNLEDINKDNEDIPEGAELDYSGLYYWVKNKNSLGESRWRTQKQIECMERRNIEAEKVSLWDRFREMNIHDWNKAVKLSSEVIKLRSKINL